MDAYFWLLIVLKAFLGEMLEWRTEGVSVSIPPPHTTTGENETTETTGAENEKGKAKGKQIRPGDQVPDKAASRHGSQEGGGKGKPCFFPSFSVCNTFGIDSE